MKQTSSEAPTAPGHTSPLSSPASRFNRLLTSIALDARRSLGVGIPRLILATIVYSVSISVVGPRIGSSGALVSALIAAASAAAVTFAIDLMLRRRAGWAPQWPKTGFEPLRIGVVYLLAYALASLSASTAYYSSEAILGDLPSGISWVSGFLIGLVAAGGVLRFPGRYTAAGDGPAAYGLYVVLASVAFVMGGLGVVLAMSY